MKDEIETAFPWTHGDAGMTLRDYFAAKALQALISNSQSDGFVGEYARTAYRYADEMLATREEM